MTISPPAASRRYFDKSSLTFANATSRIRGPFFVEPLLRVRFLEDGKDFDCCFLDVIKHPYFINSQAILRTADATQPLIRPCRPWPARAAREVQERREPD